MSKKSGASSQNMLDAMRPTEADGPLRSVILSTYGLSLEQPNFFEHDFLPTLLGLGGVRDRGFVAPVALERKLAEIYCALVCDAHALADGARPSLRIDVIPIARPRHHAKVVFIHRQRLIRIVISSANLTDSGYRHQREAAAVLDFRPDGDLPTSILDGLIPEWLTSLGSAATAPLRSALDAAASAASAWPTRDSVGLIPDVQVIFGGAASPLWRRLVDAWPIGEPLLSWQVCSPFWPAGESQTTPFEAIANSLIQRDTSLAEAEIELICSADVIGDRARPVFPFDLLRRLRERSFPITRGRLVPARLETLEDEIPDRKSVGQRPLHAKWVLLRGPNTAVALLGSANFTNAGLGVAGAANIEACILLKGPASIFRESDWCPPLVERGAVDFATCADHNLFVSPSEPDDEVDWPTHVQRIDLDIDWGQGAEPAGRLVVSLLAEPFTPTSIFEPAEADGVSRELVQIGSYPDETNGQISVSIEPTTVRRLLVHRTAGVQWGEPPSVMLFPINVMDVAKAGLPSVLGARPDEQQLLAYFHGRIGEDDLLSLLEQRAQQLKDGAAAAADTSPPAELQSYLIREFVESLFGLQSTLANATYSPRALETALLGEFSPAALAERVLTALRAGRRSPTAAAFQMAELLRVVTRLPLAETAADQAALAEVLQRSIGRLLEMCSQAAKVPSFAGVLSDPHFAAYVRASLPRVFATRLLAIQQEQRSEQKRHDLKSSSSGNETAIYDVDGSTSAPSEVLTIATTSELPNEQMPEDIANDIAS